MISGRVANLFSNFNSQQQPEKDKCQDENKCEKSPRRPQVVKAENSPLPLKVEPEIHQTLLISALTQDAPLDRALFQQLQQRHEQSENDY